MCNDVAGDSSGLITIIPSSDTVYNVAKAELIFANLDNISTNTAFINKDLKVLIFDGGMDDVVVGLEQNASTGNLTGPTLIKFRKMHLTVLAQYVFGALELPRCKTVLGKEHGTKVSLHKKWGSSVKLSYISNLKEKGEGPVAKRGSRSGSFPNPSSIVVIVVEVVGGGGVGGPEREVGMDMLMQCMVSILFCSMPTHSNGLVKPAKVRFS